MQPQVELSVRPKNGPEIQLGPGHHLVRMFRTSLTRRKGHTMSTAAIETVAVSDRMAAYVVLKNEVAKAASGITGRLATAVNWLRQTLHLDAAAGYVKAAWGFLRGKVASVAALVGRTGLVGAATMAVSTTTGRKVLKAVTVTPVAYVANKVGSGYVALETKIGCDKPAGFRNFIAGQMARARRKVEDTKKAIVTSVITARISHALRINGPLMAVTRGAGALVFFGGCLSQAALGMAVLPAIILGGLSGAAVGQFVLKPILNSTFVLGLRVIARDLKAGIQDGLAEEAAEIVVNTNGHKAVAPKPVRV